MKNPHHLRGEQKKANGKNSRGKIFVSTAHPKLIQVKKVLFNEVAPSFSFKKNKKTKSVANKSKWTEFIFSFMSVGKNKKMAKGFKLSFSF